MKLLTIFTTLITMFSLASFTTKEQEEFVNGVTENYDYYQVLLTEDTTAGDLVVYVGLYQEKFSISIFFYQKHSTQHQIKIIEQGKTSNYKSSSSSYFFYKIAVSSPTITIQIVEKSQGSIYKSYDLSLPTSNLDFKQTAVVGEGIGSFPKNPFQISMTSIMFFMVMGFIGISLIFVLIILFFVKTKRGLFNPNVQKAKIEEMKQVQNELLKEYTETDEGEEDIWDRNPVFEEPDFNYREEGTKEEQMEALFKAYHEGKINENDLNAALRSLWWENDPFEDD